MKKPADRLNPQTTEDRLNPVPKTECTNSWSQFQEWAGMDWFSNKPLLPPTDKIEDEKGTHDERTERFDDLDG